MFLVEAALGKEHTILKDDWTLKKPPPKHDCIVARGTVEPDPKKDTTITIDGLKVSVPQAKEIQTGRDSRFHHNEVLDPACSTIAGPSSFCYFGFSHLPAPFSILCMMKPSIVSATSFASTAKVDSITPEPVVISTVAHTSILSNGDTLYNTLVYLE